MRFVVRGSSMEPTFVDGDILRVRKSFKKLDVGDAVVLHDPRDGRLILKRIEQINAGHYFVKGDNFDKSTDSRRFGEVTKNEIVGKILKKLS